MLQKIIPIAGGASFILLGMLMLFTQLESDLVWNVGIIIFIITTAAGTLGLLFRGRAGRLGKIGLYLSLAGLILVSALFLSGDLLPELPWAVFSALFLCVPAGLGIYGIAALRSRPLVWGNGLPLIAAVLLAAIFLQDQSWPRWAGQALTFLLGASFAALGYLTIINPEPTSEGAPLASPGLRPALLGGLGLLAALVGVQAYVMQVRAGQTTCPAPLAAVPRLEGSPRPVIVDVDMAHEDMIAATYLLQHPDIDVLAITVAATGEAHCEGGVRNARDLLALHGRADIPVACGSETPMAGDHEFPAAWRQAADELYGIELPESAAPAMHLHAPDLIASIVRESPEKVTIVAVGPLTNLGQALEIDRSLTEGIEEIFIMGGAVEIGGNVGMSGAGIDNPVAEWNIYIDPRAANIVFSSGAPVTLVPLNATRHAPVTTDFYACIQEQHATPEAEFVYDILRANYAFIESGGFQFWDTLTAAILTDESLADYEAISLVTVEEEGLSSGHTRPDRHGYPVRVAMSADGERFEAMLLAVLNQGRGE